VDAIVCTPEQSRSLLKSLELPGEKLPGNRSQQLAELLTECLDVFAMCDAKLGCTDLVKHSNDTSDHGAIRQQLYWVPMAYHDRIDEGAGYYKTICESMGCPIILVPKRIVSFDFALIIDVSILQLESMCNPFIDSMIFCTPCGRHDTFSSLDLDSGYWLV